MKRNWLQKKDNQSDVNTNTKQGTIDFTTYKPGKLRQMKKDFLNMKSLEGYSPEDAAAAWEETFKVMIHNMTPGERSKRRFKIEDRAQLRTKHG